MKPWKPSPQQILAASGRTVPDLIAPGLKILFSGINPSLYSAAVGHHFARPGNRYWTVLHRAGFTPRLFSSFEGASLLELRYGITNLVERSTAKAEELSDPELLEGRLRLETKVATFGPKIVAFLGITAYRSAFGRRQVSIGPQAETIANSVIWVLPNPSGLNAYYQLSDLARLYGKLREASEV